MDENVLAAMARWPNVPAAYGWLSLDGRGRLRLHPQGDSAAGGPGVPITHPGIQDFLRRNYARDARGCWYVQNGPQRAYVRLDAAPFILQRAGEGQGLQTHGGAPVPAVAQWWLDEEAGHLYALADAGPARVDDRDLAAILSALRTADGRAAMEVLEAGLPPQGVLVRHAELHAGPAPLQALAGRDPAEVLGFVRHPRPDTGAGEAR